MLACGTFWQTMTSVPGLLLALLAFPARVAGVKGNLVCQGGAMLSRCLPVSLAGAREVLRPHFRTSAWEQHRAAATEASPGLPSCVGEMRPWKD